MESSKKVTDFKKILSTIAEPQSRTEERNNAAGKSLPFSSSTKSLSLGLGNRGPRPLSSPSNLTVAHKLNFSDESALLNNTTSMELTACTPKTSVAGVKRKSDQERLLVEGELTSAQGKITSLTNQLDVERNLKKRLKIEQEKEIRDFQAEKIALETQNKDLLDKLRRLEQAKEAAEQTASSAKAKSSSEKTARQTEKHELEMLVENLKTDIHEMKNNLDYANGDIDRLNDSAEMAREDADLQLEEMQRAAEYDRDRIERLQEEVDELRSCRNLASEAENRILDLDNQIRSLQEEAQLGKLFKEQSEEIRRLQLANDELCERNRILSTTQEDTSVLQEKLRSANAKIKRTEDRLQDMTRLNVEITKLRSAVAEWENVLSEVLPDRASASAQGPARNRLTTEALRDYLAKSQYDLLYASEQRQKIELELGSAHDLENQLREELSAAKTDHQREQQKVRQQQELLIKLRKKYQLITKERDSYRCVLNSYESEMTANPADDVNRKRLEDLEEVLAGYRREVDREFLEVPNLGKVLPTPQPPAQPPVVVVDLETESTAAPVAAAVDPSLSAQMEVAATTETPDVVQTEDEMAAADDAAADDDGGAVEPMVSKKTADENEAALREEIDRLAEKLKDVQAENAKLRDDDELLKAENVKLNDMLEGQRMKGDYDPAETKVVHMRFNPFEMMKQKKMDELKDLKIENEKLAARLRSIEPSDGSCAKTLAIRVDDSEPGRGVASAKELEEMKAKINAAELKNKRLVEAFQKTSQDLREAVFRLFGYKLDIPMSKKYKLMSMYADSPGDFLLFSMSGSGEMQLLETEFSSSLTDLIDAYLGDADSIPAFLASVTMDLFNKQTLA